MDESTLYELVTEALRDVLNEEQGRGDVVIARGLTNGRILFEDDKGREVRAVSTLAFFKKITAVREKLRVLEQKINNHEDLPQHDKVQIQGYITGCYGALKTFNFLFTDREEWFGG